MARAPQRAWQRMLSGRRLDLLDPSPLDVELSDIAHGLARVARWNGQTNGDYAFSVAQHSVLVMHLALAGKPEMDGSGRLYALLHDAPEYVMGDIISPLKAAMGGQYKDLEDRLLSAIHVRFSLAAKAPTATTKLIKKADKEAAYFEAVNLAGFEPAEARKIFGEPSLASFDLPDFDQLIRPWPIHVAHEQFVAVFTSILGPIK
ncbi:HD family hydrolase [Maritalea porphyrae]|jgi:5'-deoxynucleotidase YfbR-like HD superfamily hydrolase|uniref:HD family hydrolase n=1 Tax=Maritalea porphyrae TaxID=880732 RepID=UPI0022AE5916|nr:HD family hydrolase [Maritalea porphyrae]MCZ4271335.1 HD family hydrolase [Maritalea porphyrae]